MKTVMALGIMAFLLSPVALAEPEVVARLSFEDWGGYQVRFGDLNNDGSLDVLAARRRGLDAHDTVVGCLTAYDIKAQRIIWQRGNPSECETSNFSDLPFQVYDLDNDGLAEIIAVLDDNEIHILCGQTGETIRARRVRCSTMPLYLSDAITIANITGKDRASDIIIKDRHTGFVVLNADLSEVAQFSVSGERNIMAHFPLTYDFDHDGADEIMWGGGIIKLEGDKFMEIWRTTMGDHMDCFAFLGANIAVAADSCYVVSLSGEIQWHAPRTHAQKLSAGNFRSGTGEQQLAVLTLHDPAHDDQDTVCVYDSSGALLWEHAYGKTKGFQKVSGWSTNGLDCLLISRVKAMDALLVDGEGVEIARLAAPAHCSNHIACARYGCKGSTRSTWVEPRQMVHVFDMTGDGADEVAIWNLDGLVIYSKGDSAATLKDYANDRKLYNYSAYTPQPRDPDGSMLAFIDPKKAQ